MAAHAFNLSSGEAEAGGSLWILGQPGPQRKLQDSQSYTEKPCLEGEKKNPEVIRLMEFPSLKYTAVIWALVHGNTSMPKTCVMYSTA